MSAWIAWRLVKFLGVALLSGGTLAVITRADRAGRLGALHRLVTPGLVLTWLGGYGLMVTSARSFELWIVAGLLASFVGFHGSAMTAFLLAPKPVTRALGPAGLFAAVALMVTRPAELRATLPAWILGAALGALVSPAVGAPAAPGSRADQAAGEAQDEALAWAWFRQVAWLEGASLVLLMLVVMPLRRLAGIQLDGGLLGWTHGVLFLVYLQALWSTGRLRGWSAGRYALGLGAAVVPMGTFFFERAAARA